MLNAENGQSYVEARSIFPIVTFIKGTEQFICLGTGFIIKEEGGFVTAKHVIEDNFNDQLFGVFQLSDGNMVSRKVIYLSKLPNADIALGFLGDGFDGKARKIPHELSPNFRLSFKKLDVGDKVLSFGYPRTTIGVICKKTTFQFKGEWVNGQIEDYYEEGTNLLKDRCYQAGMFFDTGSSGGPVIKDGYVVGINSCSMRCENPYSLITPIDCILIFTVFEKGKWIPFQKLIDDKHITAVF